MTSCLNFDLFPQYGNQTLSVPIGKCLFAVLVIAEQKKFCSFAIAHFSLVDRSYISFR